MALCLLVGASGADNGAAWIGAGTALVLAAVLAFTVAGRVRCARLAN